MMRGHLKHIQHAVAISIIFMFLVLLRQEGYSGDLLKYGAPFIKHFTKKDYNAGNKNWSVTQGSNGFIYVGNTNGLLQYDGIRWKKFNLPGGTIIRSVYADGNRIYSGSLGEFGYWETDHKFDLRYNSLASLIDHDFGDEEIWWIVKFKNDIMALYGASEASRDYNTTDMSRIRMYNEYLAPYRAALEEGAGSIMTSFNEIDGIPAPTNGC